MKSPGANSDGLGRVASLHLHPPRPGAPFHPVDSIEVVVDKGIVGNGRYFDRRNHTSGEPGRRQVSLIEREQIAEHAAALGLKQIAPGAVRSNVETIGVNLVSLIGQHVEIGEAVFFLCEARTPCSKMDAVCAGLRSLMDNRRQGVLAQVVRSGRIRLNDSISLVERPSLAATA